MIGVLHVLKQRRMALQERSDAQRMLIAESGGAIASRAVIVDKVVTVARGIAVRPLVFGSLVALAVIVGPLRILGWATRVAAFYGLARQLVEALSDTPR